MIRARLFDNPWWIVVGSTIGLIVGNGPVSLFSSGVFSGFYHALCLYGNRRSGAGATALR